MNKLGGINRETGAFITGEQHLTNSVIDILTTPIGSRIYNRSYGSDVFNLIDRPKNAALAVDLVSAVVVALEQWEPRITVDQVTFNNAADNQLVINLYASYRLTGEAVTIEEIQI